MTPFVLAHPPELIPRLLFQFDNEHDLPKKEQLLQVVTSNQDAGAALLRLAKSTANMDSRWMAMRGMATLHYMACAPFLEASLRDSDALVRANAARALGDLRITSAAVSLLAMFAAEHEAPAIQQASLALRLLDIKAAAPAIRRKIPIFTGQTRAWLIKALGTLGNATDVPIVAGYLDEMVSGSAATDEGRVLKRETLAQMWTPTKLKNGETARVDGEPYGLGWMVDDLSGHRVVAHPGFTGCIMIRFISDDFTVIVLTNLDVTAGAHELVLALGITERMRPELAKLFPH